MLPDPIQKFIKVFSGLPGIGLRQATRLAFHLINSGKNNIDEAAKAVSDLGHLKLCSRCFFIHQNPASNGNLCDICANNSRRKDIIAIVETESDLISLERTKKFKGVYLVFGEISKAGVLESIQKLRLNHLKNLIKQAHSADSGQAHSTDSGRAEEIIIAFNPTTYGDLNSSIVAKELAPFANKISRLGRGIPTGGEIEFADDQTLGEALERRN